MLFITDSDQIPAILMVRINAAFFTSSVSLRKIVIVSTDKSMRADSDSIAIAVCASAYASVYC